MARIAWTREALANLELIRAYIEQFDPNAAARLTARLFAAGDSLRDYPNRGRPAEDGLRELPTVRPYVVQYEVHGETVYILRIKHGAQRR